MKKLFILSAILFATASQASLTQIISAEVRDNKAHILVGFSDSSFDYKKNDLKRDKSFCYVGSVSGVCAQIYNAAFNTGGDRHDYMEVKTCKVITRSRDNFHVDSSSVVTKYNLSDDYGSDFDVIRTIKKCSFSSQI